MIKRIASFLLILIAVSGLAFSQNPSKDSETLTSMLRAFLDGAAKGDRAAFERFFADDVIYTRAVGAVLDRAAILKNVEPPKPGEPSATYDAGEILIHQKGDVAVVNFRLVVHGNEQGKPSDHYYRNTGTFLRQNGEWKVIAWQATPIAP
jgi:ketosteroid isomerase-like protein